jgi:hypothetical protein
VLTYTQNNARRYPSLATCVRAGIVAALIALTGGCASTPQGSIERDSDAKQYATHPASATLYIYRPDIGDSDSDTVLWVDGRLVGATLPRTYFRVNLVPGKHTITGMGHDQGKLTLETRPGELYFVSVLNISGNSLFWQVPAEIGRQAVNRCCALMENWTPGQRPLLR